MAPPGRFFDWVPSGLNHMHKNHKLIKQFTNKTTITTKKKRNKHNENIQKAETTNTTLYIICILFSIEYILEVGGMRLLPLNNYRAEL